jgi:hypothetical protein
MSIVTRLAVLMLLAPGALSAQDGSDRAALVTRLGEDTLAVERFTRTADELRAEVVVRVPRTTLKVYRMRLGDDGTPVRLEATEHDPAAGSASAPLSREVVHFGADTVRIERAGEEPVAVPAGGRVLPFIDMVHWPFELMLTRAHQSSGDSLVIPLLTGRRTQPFVVARTGPGQMTVRHPFRGTMEVRVDDKGRLQQLDASETTRKLLVTRVADVPLDSLAREYAARDTRGAGIGELSGRGEVQARVAGAEIGVDYGRPVKRGRDIFGALVPWGEVWRTGANQATHLTTDRDLLIGGQAVPASTYSVFTIPKPEGWTLILNRRTGINGTAYDAAHDLARIPMQVRTLDEPVEVFTVRVDEEGQGGVLKLQWDRTEALVPFTVQPS